MLLLQRGQRTSRGGRSGLTEQCAEAGAQVGAGRQGQLDQVGRRAVVDRQGGALVSVERDQRRADRSGVSGGVAGQVVGQLGDDQRRPPLGDGVEPDLAGQGGDQPARLADLGRLDHRQGDDAAARTADALIPAESFFGLLRGKTRPAPDGRLERVTPPVLGLARQLQRAGDTEAALGELLIALGTTQNEAEAVAVAEALQTMGEYGSSTERAREFIEAGSRARRTYRVAYPLAYETAVRSAALEFDVPPALVWAVMRQESLFYPRAVSVSDAKGPMQFVPGTWEYVAELLNEPPANPFDPAASARYGAFYLSRLLTSFGGNLAHSVAAYNGGPGYVGRLLEEPHVTDEADFYRFITRDETREYVSRVLYNYAVYTELY